MDNKVTEQELDLDDESLEVIEEEDFAVVVSAEGQLKTIFFPVSADPNDPVPDNILKIMQIFGITDVDQLNQPRTLH
jgi:hypothetical protein